MNFMLTANTNVIQERATMWLSHFFINKCTSTILKARFRAESSNRKSTRRVTFKSKYLMTYPWVVDFLLKKCVTVEIIAGAKTAVTRFTQPAEMGLPERQSIGLEDRLFIKESDSRIRRCMRGYWGVIEEATHHHLEFHATSLLRLQKKPTMAFTSLFGITHARTSK